MNVGDKHGAWEVRSLPQDGKVQCLCTACGESLQKLRVYDLTHGKTLMCSKCTKKGTQKQNHLVDEVQSTYYAMKDRCLNPACKDYKHYGARGITIHPLWIKSFEAFYLHIGPRPSSDCTIERIDYNKSYVPGNVKWLPRKEQPKNKRDNIRLTIDGETKLVSEWAQDPRCTVDAFCIYKRLKRDWDPKKAVLTPSKSLK